MQTASASALLVLPVAGRLFAIAFGQGRFLLAPFVVEATFGLRVTLNSVAEDRIRSIDKKTFEGIATHTREQASKDTSIAGFGIDVERDPLRAVTGTPEDETLGSRLSGMDSLTATCKVSLETLPGLLARYLARSAETTYKERYGWIDYVLEVRDKSLRKTLDASLADRLRAGLRIKAPGKRPNASEFEIAYLVASRSAKPLDLPFFSRVTLRNAQKQLENLNFHVSLTKVPIV